MKKKLRLFIKNIYRRRAWRRLVSISSCIVVFVTTYALLLPAITMGKMADCGLEEHQHSDECYREYLICGLEESKGHQHSDSCYTIDRHLICTAEEHTHDQDCYDAEGNLTCALEEHSHSEECYREDRILSCQKEETEGHCHDASCYEKVLVCGKEVHTHSAKCFENDSNVPELEPLEMEAEDIGPTFKPGKLTAQGDDYTITLDYSEEAGIPENASLAVREITAETDKEAYEACLEQAEQQVAADEKTSVDKKATRFFDIEIIAAEKDSDGTEKTVKIEPSAPVSVQIQINEKPASPASQHPKTEQSEPTVLHFGEEGVEKIDSTVTDIVTDAMTGRPKDGQKNVQENSQKDNRDNSQKNNQKNSQNDSQKDSQVNSTEEQKKEIRFEAESFSIYGMIYTVDLRFEVNGKNYLITVNYGPEAQIPQDAELAVEEITEGLSAHGKTYEDYVTNTENALGMEEGSSEYIRLFEISIMKAGEKIQPAKGSSVDVRIELTDSSSDRLNVVHFADGAEEGEKVQSSTESGENGSVVEFKTDGFSVYSIVEAKDPYTPAAQTVASLEEFNQIENIEDTGFYLSIKNPSQYFSSALNGNGCLVEEGNHVAAAPWYFEPVEGTAGQYYIYTFVNGVKKYIKQTTVNGNANSLLLVDSPATKFVLEDAGNGKIYIKHADKNLWLQHSNGGGGIRFWNAHDNAENSKITLTYADSVTIPNNYYGLDGQTWGIVYDAESIFCTALMQDLSGQDMAKIDTQGHEDQLFVPVDSDLTEWTFHSIEGDKYYLTTKVDGADKYLTIQNDRAVLQDLPVPNSVIQVMSGTGEHKGCYSFSAGGYMLAVSGNEGSRTFTVASNTDQKHCWMKLAEKSPLSADDYLIYTAKKISASNPAQPDHTQEVVLYTRVWNGSKYEFYAVNHDGSLLRCYDDGDVIKWVDDQFNTAVWTLTDHYKNDAQGNPVLSGYYSLQNNYSDEYIAPSLADSSTFADELAKLNLDGRYYQEDYTKITYWDDTYYSYVGLKVDLETMKVVPCPSSQAGDFYFARIKEPKPNLTEVKTVDNDEFGITMKMIDFNNPVANDRDSEQTKYFGRDSNKAGLLTTDIKEDGYPGTTYNNNSLGNLFAGVNQVNHLFIQSIYDESGYFEYDSTMNYAYLEGNEFEVYDQLGTVERSGNVDTMYHGQFMPYNSLINPETNEPWPYSDMYTNTKTVLAQDLPEDDPRYGEGLHEIPTSKADYFFGMEMSASFTQTADGKDAWGNDIIFEFSGDDDFWFYVDGELVLDLGGVHRAMTGFVNFSTGIVTGRNGETKTLRQIIGENYKKRNPQATSTQVTEYLNGIFGGPGTVFPDFTTHKMQVYFMERGKGASNLHMRFNLTAVKPGEVTLSKEITGSNDVDYDLMEFPYQVWYRTWETTEDGLQPGEYQLLTQNAYKPTALHQGTKRPVKFASTYTPVDGGKSYDNVFFLKPGEIASFDMPDNVVDYKIVECGVNMNIFKSVEVNGTKLSGEDDEGRHDYTTSPASIDDRPKVEFVNEVDPDSLRTLTISKVLWDENGFTIENEGTENETREGNRLYGYEDDTTTFGFRVYMAASESDELTLVKNKEYFFKDRYGNYCRWDVATQKFISLGITDYHVLAEHLETLTDHEKESIVFVTSNNGSVSKVPAGFSVEFRGMPVDAVFKVVEEEDEIPAGYKLIDYERDKGSYFAEGTKPNQGVIRANEDPHVLVNNQRGWGLTVKKVWSDADFMQSHDDIYFAVYVNGELLEGSVRKMTSAQTSLYYGFDQLKPGTTFDKYEVYEVKVNNPQVENGIVTSYASVHKIDNGDTAHIDGIPKDDEDNKNFKYEVTYTRGEADGGNDNVRVDTVYNTRSGIKLIKTDWNGHALPNARFTLKDSQGRPFGADTYTSDENGLITIAYLAPKSTYILEEIKTPGGFQKPDGSWTITREANDDVTVTGPDGTYTVMQATHTDMAVVTFKNKGFSLQAFKIKQREHGAGGNDDPLAGAVFALHKQMDTVSGKVKAPDAMSGYSALTTGEDGLIPKITSALPAGTYYLSEITPPGGYKKLNGDLVFTVTGSGTIEIPVPVETGDPDTLVILNNLEDSAVASWIEQDTTVPGNTTYTLRIPNELAGVPIRIIKTDQEGKPLEGAGFSLEGGSIDEGSLVSKINEGDTEALIYANDALPIGTYTLTEIGIPDGYLALEGPVTIKVESSEEGIKVKAEIGDKEIEYPKLSRDTATGVWTVIITNQSGFELPSTGGPGTNLIYIFGTILTVLAGAGLVMIKRRSCSLDHKSRWL